MNTAILKILTTIGRISVCYIWIPSFSCHWTLIYKSWLELRLVRNIKKTQKTSFVSTWCFTGKAVEKTKRHVYIMVYMYNPMIQRAYSSTGSSSIDWKN